MQRENLQELFVVDEIGKDGIRAAALSDMIDGRHLLFRPRIPDDPGPEAPDVPPELPSLALVPDDLVVAGQVYPALDNGPGFAVPRYELQVVDGRYTTSLRWRRPDEDPNGPIAFFTVKLAVRMPDSPDGRQIREISHQLTARLRHSVRVDGAADQAAQLTVQLGAVQRLDSSTAEIRYPITEKAEFDALWQAITNPAAPATIELSGPVTVGRRTWRQVPRFDSASMMLASTWRDAVTLTTFVPAPPEPPQRVIDLDPDPPIDPRTIEQDPRVDKLDRLGKLDRLRDTIDLRQGRLRSEAQFMSSNAPLTFAQPAAIAEFAEPELAQFAQPELAQFAQSATEIAQPAVEFAAPAAAEDITAAARARIDGLDLAAPPDPLDRVFVARLPGQAFLPPRADEGLLPADTAAFRDTDLQWKDQSAVPLRVITDPIGRPAVITVNLPADQAVGPFSFSVETNAYMFDVPGDLRPTATRLLLRHEFDSGGSRPRLVYYQDTAFSHRYYYEPQEFRIPRDDAVPHLPLLVMVFSDVAVQGTDGSTQVRYTARIRYSAVPDLDPVVLTALRRELIAASGNQSPDLSALLPEQATVLLRLPDDDEGGALVAMARTVTRNAFDDGFADEIEVSSTELAALVALLQTDGVRGTIQADLLGAGHTEVPVLISLRDTPAVPLLRAYRGPVGNGLVRVSVTNPLESPITITELYRSPAGSGAFAYPQADPGLIIAAGASADLDYRLDPENADVDDIEPLLRVAVHADLHVLLPKLMLNGGYAAETFDLTVTCDTAFFGQIPPGGDGPLTALLVEFAGAVQTVLATAAPTTPVKVRMPILPWLLREPGGQTYRYRVTNMHGIGEAVHPGAVGEWLDGEGAGTLTVTPVGI